MVVGKDGDCGNLMRVSCVEVGRWDRRGGGRG